MQESSTDDWKQKRVQPLSKGGSHRKTSAVRQGARTRVKRSGRVAVGRVGEVIATCGIRCGSCAGSGTTGGRRSRGDLARSGSRGRQESEDSSRDETHHAPPQGACENLVCALKLLAKSQAGGNNFVDTIFRSLQEQSRLNITNELKKFIEVHNQEAVKIGHLERYAEVIEVVTPSVNETIFLNAAVSDGLDELKLRTARS